MINELRIYTLVPGTQSEYLRVARDVGRRIRGDDYGKFEGGWTSEFGTLNQYFHLWSYADLSERERLRAGLARNEAWAKEYTPLSRACIASQENKILSPVAGVELKRPGDTGRHLYELRTYRLKPGKAPEWVGLFKGALPAREKYSKIVGLWTTEVGGLNQVVHMWAYDDLNQRAQARAGAQADPDWQAYVGKVTPLVAEQHSIILNPTDFSPLG